MAEMDIYEILKHLPHRYPIILVDRVLEIASHISPREGYTAHPVTLRAAEEIRSLVDRGQRFAAC